MALARTAARTRTAHIPLLRFVPPPPRPPRQTSGYDVGLTLDDLPADMREKLLQEGDSAHDFASYDYLRGCAPCTCLQLLAPTTTPTPPRHTPPHFHT